MAIPNSLTAKTPGTPSRRPLRMPSQFAFCNFQFAIPFNSLLITPPRRPPDLKNLNQHQPCDKAANMRGVGDAARLRPAAEHAERVEQLKHQPEPNHDTSRDLCYA